FCNCPSASGQKCKSLHCISLTSKSTSCTARVEFLHLDLTDLKQVREAAEAFVKTGERLDILVNNAGNYTSPSLK
ncbi:hypothetical protein HK096_000830, partial [Nowakowskiella sp. JEL0078]